MSMLDVIVEYDQVDTDHLERSVRGLEREGYRIWLNVPTDDGEAAYKALAKRASQRIGLYSVYSEDPIGLDDLMDAVQEFGRQTGRDHVMDTGALTLFACLRGSPQLPATFQRVRAWEINGARADNDSQMRRKVAVDPAADPDRDAQSQPAPARRPTLFKEMMVAPPSGTRAAQSATRRGFSVNLPRQVQSDDGGNYIPATFQKPAQPVAPRVAEPAPAPAPTAPVEPPPPARQTAAASTPPPRPVHRHRESAPERLKASLKKPSLVDTLHLLSGLALGTSFVTLVISAVIMSGARNLTPMGVIAMAVLCALAPLVLFFVLKTFEARARAAAGRRGDDSGPAGRVPA